METENTQATLFHKISSVMAKVRTLEKTGRNTYDKYDFVTADAVATRIGSALAEAGVAFFPSIVNVETSEYTTQKGGTHFRSVVQLQITFACAETGATFTIPWFGEAIDRSDKSITKATVSAIKYALLKTFLLAGGDEDDADAHSPGTEPTAKPQPARKQAKPANANGQHPEETFTPPADNPWDGDDAPKATQAQLAEIDELGRQVYDDEWASNIARLAQWASTGNVSRLEDLLQSEADRAIGGLKKRLPESEPA